MAIYGENVVDVFDDRAQVDNAVNALQNAGFNPDEVYLSEHEQVPTSIYWDRKIRLYNHGRGRAHASKELRDLGVPEEKIRSNLNEYDFGHHLVAVHAPGHVENASAILRANGGHDSSPHFFLYVSALKG